MTQTITLRKVLLIHGALSVCCLILLYFVSPRQIPAFAAGVLLGATNFLLLAWLWRRVFDKKPVATTIGIIVIKYAALGVFLYALVRGWRLSLLPLAAGLSTLAASFLVVALQVQLQGRSR